MMIGNVQMLPGVAPFPKDAWYVACFSREVTRTPFMREIAGDPIVFYRTESGAPVALFGRCPHRGMALDKGKLMGDRLQCGYHGFEFETNGKCAFVPSGGTIPNALAVKEYALVETGGWIWIWPGRQEDADPKLIPDHHYLGIADPTLQSEPGYYLYAKSNYLMPLENLGDATHITYLHHGVVDTGNVAAHPYTIQTEGSRVTVIRVFENEILPEMFQRSLNMTSRVNRTLELTTFAPSVVLVKITFAPADDPSHAPMIWNTVVAVTPQHEKGTHEFHINVATQLGDNPTRLEEMRDVLMEDVVALEEVQAIFDHIGIARAPEVSVKADESAIRVRRLIAEMILKERQSVLAAE